MEWRKPELICYFTEDLLCKIKAKAKSAGCSSINYSDESLCTHVETSEASSGDGDGSDGFDGCSLLGPCIEMGPLLGCVKEDFWQCSEIVAVLR